MKKLILGAAAILAVAAISCNKTSDDSAKVYNDSLSEAYGRYAGTSLNMEFQNKENPDKKEFLRGMQIIFGAGDDENTLLGMQVALQMCNEINQLDEQKIYLNRAEAMNQFKAAFLVDSANTDMIMKYSQEFRELMNKAFEAKQAEANKEASESKEAVENGAAADKYISGLKAKDADIKTTDSGLSYKIELPGEGDKPGENATVVVNYTGRHINGDVFDSTSDRGPATFNLQGVVPGFREGLMLLGKGGKATLYLPGDLAYGPNGQPQAGIGPNEMLVFDVEVLDIQ